MEGKRDTVGIEIALQYTTVTRKTVLHSRTRSTPWTAGRTFRLPLGADALDQQFCFVHGNAQEQKTKLRSPATMCVKGLVAVVSVKLPQPQFEGQTRGTQ